jgi:hypothetical protein
MRKKDLTIPREGKNWNGGRLLLIGTTALLEVWRLHNEQEPTSYKIKHPVNI